MEDSSSDPSLATDDRSSTTGLPEKEAGDKIEEVQIAPKEQKAVRRSQILVFATLVVSAAALGSATYIFTKRDQERSFTSQFEDYAKEIIDVANIHSRTVFIAAENMAVATTSLAVYEGVEWPYHTNPNFERLGKHFFALTDAATIVFAPIVEAQNKSEWEAYAQAHQSWYIESLEYQNEKNVDAAKIPNKIHKATSGQPAFDDGEGPFSPVWQMAEASIDISIINYDLTNNEMFANLTRVADTFKVAILSPIFVQGSLLGGAAPIKVEGPQSIVLQPVMDDFTPDAKVVAHFMVQMPWTTYFVNILPGGADGVICVVENTCNQSFTYRLDGPDAVYLGDGDLHESLFDHMRQSAKFLDMSDFEFDSEEHCDFTLNVYPSSMLEADYITRAPVLYSFVVLFVFFCTSMAFVLYNTHVARRQTKILKTAHRTNEIVASLFPDNVRDQLIAEMVEDHDRNERKTTFKKVNPTADLKSFLRENHDFDGPTKFHTKPIADLFPQTTVMFADICGFTAWSSVREPSQVFTLLETIYSAFDEIARQRRVFKVETVGDCYVAVVGLPEPRKDHAVVMCRFARDCLSRMKEIVTKLEVTLGPDTAELALRIGLHSGPVTAGVLRGERARFQLFGDTVNTAARMETTGTRNRIQLSPETAALVMETGKENWVKLRDDIIVAKGKGALQTYWLVLKSAGSSTAPSTTSSDDQTGTDVEETDENATKAGKIDRVMLPQSSAFDLKVQRLIDWNCELLLQLLKKIFVRRQIQEAQASNPLDITRLETEMSRGATALQEIVEVVALPGFNAKYNDADIDHKTIDLGDEVTAQLRDFIGVLASLYRDNPFHCYEHASHVTMSVSKLLSRIVAPSESDKDLEALHDHTYGITSDPLTQFAVVLAALIHDVDHRGVPNSVLCKEDPTLASVYGGKSVAEQNSIDLAWNALMDPSFTKLRSCIYADEQELGRFRQLIVNSVMATDIFDKELGTLRKDRWTKAFTSEVESIDATIKTQVHRKATIVIEHLIQASDVAHTMQHWHVYQKWNERLFQEMYKAFQAGRLDKDPSIGWYEGELGFFDGYILPLACKLKECGVFGVASDEYLNYANNNRKEWERKGQDVVASMVEKHGGGVSKVDDVPTPPVSFTATPKLLTATQA